MSRTKKQPYTKSKRFDKTCRNHGSCPYCKENRLHTHSAAEFYSRQDFEEWLKGDSKLLSGPEEEPTFSPE